MTLGLVDRQDRMPAFLSGRIVYMDKSGMLDCHVKNLSTTGAKIAIADSIGVPEEFELQIPARNLTHHAVVKWRRLGAVGVEFVLDGPPETPLELRVRVLEDELRILRTRFAELTRRLPMG